jgi:hypothetical protein
MPHDEVANSQASKPSRVHCAGAEAGALAKKVMATGLGRDEGDNRAK